MSAHSDTPTVEIIHRVNRLKQKVTTDGVETEGGGFICPDSIQKAQAVIDNSHESYKQELRATLKTIEDSWTQTLAAPENAQTTLEQIQRCANHIGDIAGTYGFDLMHHFGTSLRDFSERIDITNDAHTVIVKAHLDTMWIACNEDLKSENSPKAAELKRIVARAIEKHSQDARVASAGSA